MPIQITVRMSATKPLSDEIVAALYRTGHLAPFVYSVETHEGGPNPVDVEILTHATPDALGALTALTLWASSFRPATAIRPVLQIEAPRVTVELSQAVAGAKPCRTAMIDTHRALQLLSTSGVLQAVDRVLMTPNGQHRWDAIADVAGRAAYLVNTVEERVRRTQGSSHLPTPRK